MPDMLPAHDAAAAIAPEKELTPVRTVVIEFYHQGRNIGQKMPFAQSGVTAVVLSAARVIETTREQKEKRKKIAWAK
jgi:hypothetical protein